MSNITNKSRRVSIEQMNILWDFLNTHRDIASAYNRSLQAKDYSYRKWREITETLNAVGIGADKDWRGWSKYWVDYKAKLKKRVAAVRTSRTQTGGGPSTEQPLSEMEIKFLGILGEHFGQGLPGIRVEPLIQLPANTTVASLVAEEQDSPSSESILQPGNAGAVFDDSIILPMRQPPPTDRTINSPNRTRTPSPSPHPPSTSSPPAAAAAAAHVVRQSPRRRRRRREPPMSQEAARRALVQSSQIRAEAALRKSVALENIAQNIADMCASQQRIERILGAAFPTAAE